MGGTVEMTSKDFRRQVSLVGLNGADELTIASGAVTVSRSAHTIDTQSDASTDDLDTINGGQAGALLVVMPANAARTVVLKHATGNIYCPGAADVELAEVTDAALLVYNGSNWVVQSVSRLAEGGGGVYRATGSIAAASVATLNATPVSLVAAPGAGKYLDPVVCHWMLDHQGVDYDGAAAGEDLAIKYTNASGAKAFQDVDHSGFADASADAHSVVQPQATVVPVVNAALVAHVLNGEWYAAAGDGILRFDLLYRVRDFDLSD